MDQTVKSKQSQGKTNSLQNLTVKSAKFLTKAFAKFTMNILKLMVNSAITIYKANKEDYKSYKEIQKQKVLRKTGIKQQNQGKLPSIGVRLFNIFTGKTPRGNERVVRTYFPENGNKGLFNFTEFTRVQNQRTQAAMKALQISKALQNNNLTSLQTNRPKPRRS